MIRHLVRVSGLLALTWGLASHARANLVNVTVCIDINTVFEDSSPVATDVYDDLFNVSPPPGGPCGA